jgi:hypothetical protein
LVQHTLLDHGPWSIINNLGNCPNLWTWCTTLKHQWLLPSIVKGNDKVEANLVFTRVLSLHGSTPHIWTCLLPLSSSFTTLFGPCDGFLQNGLCFLDQDWCQTNILWIFHGMVTSLGHGMALTRPHKRCWQPQNFTRHNKVKVEVVVERLNFPSCLTYYAMTQTLNSCFASISPHLQSHGISKL